MIVSFGTINVDLVTSVARFPVPGETIKGHEFAIFPGGKGANQALSARRAGADVMLAGAVGSDGFSDAALSNLREAGVDLSLVQRSSVPTGIYMIAIDPSGENLAIGANSANNDARAEPLRVIFEGPGGGDRLTLMTQNSLGTVEVEAAIAMARRAGCRIVYNAAPAEPVAEATFRAADVIVMNEHEAAAYAKRLSLPEDVAEFVRRFAARFATSPIVTLGPAGLVAMLDGRLVTAKPPVIDAVDTTGAGDAFCGALAAALDRGDGLDQAVLKGLAAGSLACQLHGAQSSFATRQTISALANTLTLEAL